MGERRISLAWVDIGGIGKGLSSDGAACNGGDGLNFILGQLHGREDQGKARSLIRCLQVVDDCICLIVAAKNGYQTLVDPINELVADAYREMFIPGKRLHSIHHALIIRKGGSADYIAVVILI
jgi:hypothetical protein